MGGSETGDHAYSVARTNYLMRVTFFVLVATLALTRAWGQKSPVIATTQDGRKTLVYPDGTWKLAEQVQPQGSPGMENNPGLGHNTGGGNNPGPGNNPGMENNSGGAITRGWAIIQGPAITRRETQRFS